MPSIDLLSLSGRQSAVTREAGEQKEECNITMGKGPVPDATFTVAGAGATHQTSTTPRVIRSRSASPVNSDLDHTTRSSSSASNCSESTLVEPSAEPAFAKHDGLADAVMAKARTTLPPRKQRCARQCTKSNPGQYHQLGPRHLEHAYTLAWENLRDVTCTAAVRLGYKPARPNDTPAAKLLAEETKPTLQAILFAKFKNVERARRRLDAADQALNEALRRGENWENTPWPEQDEDPFYDERPLPTFTYEKKVPLPMTQVAVVDQVTATLGKSSQVNTGKCSDESGGSKRKLIDHEGDVAAPTSDSKKRRKVTDKEKTEANLESRPKRREGLRPRTAAVEKR